MKRFWRMDEYELKDQWVLLRSGWMPEAELVCDFISAR